MSIWSSLDGPEVLALNNTSEASNYRAEGTETVTVDVATARSYHAGIRLSLFGDDSDPDEDVILTPESALLLADKLQRAARAALGKDSSDA